jgi:glutathione S-transferase
MADTITFYHNPKSRGRIVHWMLEEVGTPYETTILDFAKNEHKPPAYLAINPMGKIPAIVHRDTVVTETGAICAYLADAFPAAGLAPAFDDPARGTYCVGCSSAPAVSSPRSSTGCSSARRPRTKARSATVTTRRP